MTYPDAVRRLTPLEAERLQGFPDGWTVPGGLTPAEIAGLDSARYAALGNAVTVPVARWIGQRIVQSWQVSPQRSVLPSHVSPVEVGVVEG